MNTLLVFNGLLELLMAGVILRASFQQRENRLLALAALIDTARIASVLVLVNRGHDITDPLPQLACSLGRILVMCPVLEFAYAFPFGGRPQPWMRAIALAATAVATLASLHPVSSAFTMSWPFRVAYFSPFFVASIGAAWRNLARIRLEGSDIGERTFIGALMVRFAAELATSTIVAPLYPELLASAITADVIVAMLSYGVAAFTVLKYRIFRVSGLVAEAVLYGTLWLASWTLVVVAAESAARHTDEPVLRALAFSALMVVPLATWGLISRCAPSMKAALLYPFESKRRRFRALLDGVLRESAGTSDPAALCALTRDAIGALSGGTTTLWKIDRVQTFGWHEDVLGATLPVELSRYLQDAAVSALHRRSAVDPALAQAIAALKVDAIIPVRAQGQLLCAFAIKARVVEQETLDAATQLAEQLGNRLAHQALRDYAATLQHQLEVARHLSTLGSFAAAIAHDIRTPLTSVKMNVEMIRSWPELNGDMRECAEMALEELGRMNGYVSSMLDYAKPVQLRAVEFDLRGLIEEASRTLQPVLEAREVTLKTSWEEGSAPLTVRADAPRLKQVLVNLIENAADASPPGSSVDVSLEELAAGTIAVSVQDHGHGISERNLERVFEPFFTTREDGTGLGLAIVRKLVHAHGGDVQVESKHGAGSTFTVRLPKAGDAVGEAAVRAAPMLASFTPSEIRAAE